MASDESGAVQNEKKPASKVGFLRTGVQVRFPTP
jgi:hypothetical protein